MAEINGQNLATTAQVLTVAQRFKTELDTLDGRKFGDASIANGKLNFYAKTGDATAIKSIDLPAELYLDQVKTTFVSSFAFASGGYTGATNPNLDGKPVLVFAVKDNAASPNITYSFLNLEALIDTYTGGNDIDVTNNVISVKRDPATDNILSSCASGLKATAKVPNVTQGNIAIFGANGAIVDSGFSVASDADIAAGIASIFGASSGS
ncbi:MAG: hypothetical protein IJQ82_02155 [Selenomonadaceae bacterium]|nr:hypothetical protein [Selenomonadaceae bacterium]